MEHKPDNNRKKKRHSNVNWMQKFVSIIFGALIVIVAFFVYRAINEGIGLPTSSTGIVLQNTAMTTATPIETEPTEDASETEASEDVTEPTQTEAAPPLSPEALAQQYLSGMTLEEKVWQMFCLSPSQMYFDDGTLCPAGAVLYGEADLTSADALDQELVDFRTGAKTPLMIGTSEEGGANSPLNALGLTDYFSSASEFADYGDSRSVYDASAALSSQLYAAGFNFNLAPVADTINWYPAGLDGRTYGTDIELASQMVFNAVSGMQDNGMISCIKHFPNLGSSAPDGDSDVSWRPYSNFIETDFVPFKAGIEAGTKMILVSNMMVPDLCGGTLMPSCMSENIVTNILRGDLGFGGVVISDTQSTQYDSESVLGIIGAGCDMILLPSNPQASVAAIVDAVNDGQLTEERINQSVLRILLMKSESGIITE